MNERPSTPVLQPADRNIRVIAELERKALHDRTYGDRLSDTVTRATGNIVFAAINLALFAAWITVNTIGFGPVDAFDPFPFGLLTLVVSLEAIFLAIFVLMSQNRMARAADKRAQLDLQVDLLAEQELTTMLRMLHAMCAKLGVDEKVTDEQLRALLSDTDVDKLARTLERRLPAS
jgi:uncharacterized membrane protein